MKRDEQIDAMLKHLHTSQNNYSFRDVYQKVFIDKNVGKSDIDSELLFKEMKDEDLIILLNRSFTQCNISPKGLRLIEEYGGWIEYTLYLKRQKTSEKIKSNLGLYSNIIIGLLNVGLLIYSLVQNDNISDRVETLKLEVDKIKKSSTKKDSLIRLLKTMPLKDSLKTLKTP